LSTNDAAIPAPGAFDSRDERPAPTGAGKALGGAGRFVDDRIGGAAYFKKSLNKVFPDNWSFMIGEIALYSFIILLLTGTYLTLFFQDSSAEVIYHGSYLPLRDVPMSAAYASTLDISFDVRAGLLMRQIHHWAALLFMFGMVVHACRVFFTGAYRKPRELNWLIGVGLVTLGMLEGFAGYSLPDDLLSGTGLRIADAVMLSIPVVGTWVSFLLFGGEYPGTHIIERLYVIHILLIPGLILGLISAHMGLIWYQKHTQFPGPGRTEDTVTGERLFPAYAAKAGGFFMLVFGMLALMAGLFQINPVWLYGPYDPANVSAGSQPDWYIGFLEGSLRIMPNWEFRGFGYTIPIMILIPGVVLPGIMFTLFALWPWIEQRMTGDKAYHNLLQRPRESPVRAGAGMMALTFYGVLVASGANDVFASIFHISLNALTWAGRIAIIVLPPIAYVVTKKICEALNRKDAEERAHGYETGIVRRLPSGEFIEVHAPLPPERDAHLIPVETTTFAQLAERARGELVTIGSGPTDSDAPGSGNTTRRGGLVDFFVKRD